MANPARRSRTERGPDCAVVAMVVAGLDRTALTQTLEAEMDEHRAVKRWWSRRWRCSCGRVLDRCTDHFAAMARPW